MKLLKKHKEFLALLYPNCDVVMLLEENDYTEDDLNEWKRNVAGFEDKYLKAVDLTKTQQRFLKTYRKKMCNISATCRAARIGRSTVYEWGDKADTFKKEMQMVEQSLYDDVESIMFEKVFVQKDNTMIIWVSKAKMGDRGYVEKQQNTNVNLNTDKYADKSLEEIEAEIAEMEKNAKEMV